MVGTGQVGMVLCHPGILHNYRNSHHTSAQALEQGAHSLAGCLQRRVVEVAPQELAGKLLEVLVLEAMGGMQQRTGEHSPQRAPVLEVDTGHWRVVLHSLEQEEHNCVPAVQPEGLMS